MSLGNWLRLPGLCLFPLGLQAGPRALPSAGPWAARWVTRWHPEGGGGTEPEPSRCLNRPSGPRAPGLPQLDPTPTVRSWHLCPGLVSPLDSLS